MDWRSNRPPIGADYSTPIYALSIANKNKFVEKKILTGARQGPKTRDMETEGNQMIDYMVRDVLWNEYCVFQTEMEAREYVAKALADDVTYNESDFVIYKRERIA